MLHPLWHLLAHRADFIGDDDLFNVHFGIKPPYLQPEAISSADNKEWESKRINLEGYGQFVEQMPAAGSSSGSTASGSRVSIADLTRRPDVARKLCGSR